MKERRQGIRQEPLIDRLSRGLAEVRFGRRTFLNLFGRKSIAVAGTALGSSAVLKAAEAAINTPTVSAQQIDGGESLYGPDHTGRINLGLPPCYPDTFSVDQDDPDRRRKMRELKDQFPDYYFEGEGLCICEGEWAKPGMVGKPGQFIHWAWRMGDVPGLCAPIPQSPAPECPQPEQPNRVCEEVNLTPGQSTLMNGETSAAFDGLIEVTQPDGRVAVFRTYDRGKNSEKTSHLTIVTFEGIDILPPGEMVKYIAVEGNANIYCAPDDSAICNNAEDYLRAWSRQDQEPSVFHIMRSVTGWWTARKIVGPELEQFRNPEYCRSYQV